MAAEAAITRRVGRGVGVAVSAEVGVTVGVQVGTLVPMRVAWGWLVGVEVKVGSGVRVYSITEPAKRSSNLVVEVNITTPIKMTTFTAIDSMMRITHCPLLIAAISFFNPFITYD